MSMKKKGTLLLAAGAVASLVVGAAAFACTNLATLNLSSTAGKAGDVVTVTGSSFAVGRGDAPTLPVQLRWNGVDGMVLAEATPDRAGNISATFTVPEGMPGYYVLVATQRNAQGVDTYGTPARASYQILGANGQSVVTPATSAAAASVPSEPSSTGIIALTVGLGVLGLALFGTGFVAFVRQTRATAAAATAPVRRT
ncbi:MAG TPA: hypothetical protein VGV86_13020 [Acidimicrobiales bacterium]|nr:hypothetical protein [Acidimicrobiales bacterium]